MGFFIGSAIFVVVVAILGGRFVLAEGRYDAAVRQASGRPARRGPTSPLAMMRAVNAEVSDRDDLDRRAKNGEFGEQIGELYRVRTKRFRQAMVGGFAALLLTFPLNILFAALVPA